MRELDNLECVRDFGAKRIYDYRTKTFTIKGNRYLFPGACFLHRSHWLSELFPVDQVHALVRSALLGSNNRFTIPILSSPAFTAEPLRLRRDVDSESQTFRRANIAQFCALLMLGTMRGDVDISLILQPKCSLAVGLQS